MKTLYCSFCDIWPNNVVRNYIQPIEHYLVYSQESKCYITIGNNINKSSFIELCGVCGRKLEFIGKGKTV